jgi:hypothetical protein
VALVVGLPVLVAAVRRARWKPLAAISLGTLATGGLGLWYNRALTGSFFTFPAERYFDEVYGPGRYGIGFGPSRGLGWSGLDPFPGHGAIDVVVNAMLNGFMVNIDLFGWAFGSLSVVVCGALMLRRSVDRLMIATIVLVVGAHSFFWFSGGPDFGARYWFLVIVPCVILAAGTLQHFDGPQPADGTLRRPALLTAAVLTLASLATYVPWRAADKYFQYRGMQPGIRALASGPQFEGALVFVQGSRHRDWASAAILNPVNLATGGTIFAWDRSVATRQEVIEAFPGRPVWIVAGPSLAGGRYQVVWGPGKADDIPRLPPVINTDTIR